MHLVLLPGLDGTGRLHEGFVTALGDMSCDVLNYPPEMTTYAALSEHIGPLLPDTPFILIAESFSGPLALRLSRQNLANLRGIIFIASFARRPRFAPRFAADLLKFLPFQARILCQMMQPFVMGRWASGRFTNILHSAVHSVPAATLAARLIEVLDADETAALLPRTCSMLYLRARHDRLVPGYASHAFVAANIPVETHDGPHFLLQAEPEACAHSVREFVRTNERNT